MNPIKIFVSYSHQNSAWVDENGKYGLIPWLKQQLKRENVEFWTDHILNNHIGEEYKRNIKKNVQDADIALLLVSQDFATSDFILEFELPWIREEFQNRSLKIIPLLIDVLARNGRRNIPWIFELQTIPNESKPIIEYTDNAVEWSKVRIQILDALLDKIDTVHNPQSHVAEETQELSDKNSPNEQEQLAVELKELKDTNKRLELELTKQKEKPESATAKDNGDSSSKLKDIKIAKYTETVKGVSFDMIEVEGGTFLMGSSEDEQDHLPDENQHEVTLNSFLIGKTVVTQALWKAVMQNNPSHFKGDNLPVEQVNWKDCQEFLQKINQLTGKHYCLPTEAQWEFAAIGGNHSHGYVYAGSNTLNDVAWFVDNSEKCTHMVGLKQPNELEIFDMSGNVSEWCSDWYGNYPDKMHVDPKGPKSGWYHVIRGGDGISAFQNCRVAFRGYNFPGRYNSFLGLRLALNY
jgi:formylglycine-generating enzyme required for sulfatase activity